LAIEDSMTGNLVVRLERLEQMQRDAVPNPLAALSDDELTVNLLETCAAITSSDCAPEDQAAARATAERIKRDIEGWAAFWNADGWNGQASEGGPLRPLIGNCSGETERDKARHGEMHYRATAALKAIGAPNGSWSMLRG
jgi:hypothetical protein